MRGYETDVYRCACSSRSIQMVRTVQHDAGHADGDRQRVHPDHLAAGDLPRDPPGSARPGQRRLPAVDADGLPAGDRRAGRDARPARRHVRQGAHLHRRLRGLHRRVRRPRAHARRRARRRAVADRLAGGAGRGRRHADGQLGRDHHRRVPGPAAGHRPRRQPGRRARRQLRRPGARRRALRLALARDLLGQRGRRRRRPGVGIPQPRRDGDPPGGRTRGLVGQRHARDRPDRCCWRR